VINRIALKDVQGNREFTFTSTEHPIVGEGREMEEPLVIKCTREVFPTPTGRNKERNLSLPMRMLPVGTNQLK